MAPESSLALIKIAATLALIGVTSQRSLDSHLATDAPQTAAVARVY